MIKPAIQYKTQIQEIWIQEFNKPKYDYLSGCGYSYTDVEINATDWSDMSFVSIFDNKIIGLITFSLHRHSRIVTNIAAVKYVDGYTRTFCIDILTALKSLTEQGFNKIEWSGCSESKSVVLSHKLISLFQHNELFVASTCHRPKHFHSRAHLDFLFDEYFFDLYAENSNNLTYQIDKILHRLGCQSTSARLIQMYGRSNH